MATYIYNDGSGQRIERAFPIGEATEFVIGEDHCRYFRDRAAEMFTQRISVALEREKAPRGCSKWPMWSVQRGVHVDQVPSEMARLKKRGVRAEFNKDGDIRIESARHQKAIDDTFGGHNKDGVL